LLNGRIHEIKQQLKKLIGKIQPKKEFYEFESLFGNQGTFILVSISIA